VPFGPLNWSQSLALSLQSHTGDVIVPTFVQPATSIAWQVSGSNPLLHSWMGEQVTTTFVMFDVPIVPVLFVITQNAPSLELPPLT